MNDLDRLKLGAVFEIFLVSAIGYGLPYIFQLIENRHSQKRLYSKEKDVSEDGHSSANNLQAGSLDILGSDSFRIFKSLSTGIIIGVAFLHLLPEANEVLSEMVEYPRKIC